MKKQRLLDKDMNFSNYIKFKSVEILDGGATVKFIYANDEFYVVPTVKIEKWFKYPHYYCRNGRWVEFDEGCHTVFKNRKIVRTRRVKLETAVRVYFDDGTANDVAWDTILMACEPAYEHYGGLKLENRSIPFK